MRARELFFVMHSALSLLSGGSASRYWAAIKRSASVSLVSWLGASFQADSSLREISVYQGRASPRFSTRKSINARILAGICFREDTYRQKAAW